MGKVQNHNFPRLFRVKIGSQQARRQILIMHRTKKDGLYPAIFVRPDLTRLQEAADKILRDRLASAGKDRFKISNGKIIPRDLSGCSDGLTTEPVKPMDNLMTKNSTNSGNATANPRYYSSNTQERNSSAPVKTRGGRTSSYANRSYSKTSNSVPLGKEGMVKDTRLKSSPFGAEADASANRALTHSNKSGCKPALSTVTKGTAYPSSFYQRKTAQNKDPGNTQRREGGVIDSTALMGRIPLANSISYNLLPISEDGQTCPDPLRTITFSNSASPRQLMSHYSLANESELSIPAIIPNNSDLSIYEGRQQRVFTNSSLHHPTPRLTCHENLSSSLCQSDNSQRKPSPISLDLARPEPTSHSIQLPSIITKEQDPKRVSKVSLESSRAAPLLDNICGGSLSITTPTVYAPTLPSDKADPLLDNISGGSMSTTTPTGYALTAPSDKAVIAKRPSL